MRNCGFALASAVVIAAAPIRAQERGAIRLHSLVNGLTTSSRVLLVGVRPGDEDLNLLAWLSHGRAIETAYLSLTRGESGQNVLGPELGASLGAVRTQEALAARRIDGAAQYFARAFDFGGSKSSKDTFSKWDREGLLGDIVAVVRSFRPHVIVTSATGIIPGSDGQNEALGMLARDAFDAAGDTGRFSVTGFGDAWLPLKLYGPGHGVGIDPNEHDIVAGVSAADIAAEARALSRVIGTRSVGVARNQSVVLRVASRVGQAPAAKDERSIFDGIDTSFARLSADEDSSIVRSTLARYAALADSARTVLDLQRPSMIVGLLARAVGLVENLLLQLPSCARPGIEATARVRAADRCDQRTLDLDASLDHLAQQSRAALLAAAGIDVEVEADREFVAAGDVGSVDVIVRNHGQEEISVIDVAVSGSPYAPMEPVKLPPGRGVRLNRPVPGGNLPFDRPWWLGKRKGGMFPPLGSWIDGLERAGEAPASVRRVLGVAVPETIRRLTDVGVTLSIAGTTLRTSIGPAIYHHADPVLGAQDRPLAGAPTMSLSFDQGLLWIPARKPIDSRLQLSVKSMSDAEQRFRLKIVTPPGTRTDTLASPIILAPQEQREVLIRLRGRLDPGRYEFGAVGTTETGETLAEGMRSATYPHIPPVHFFRASGVWMQAVDVLVPPNLFVAYIAGTGEDASVAPALRQVGIFTMTVTPEEFSLLDLSRFHTVVIGSRAYAAHPELIGQRERLIDFARQGGTVLVLNQESDFSSVLPYPVTFATPYADRVGSPEAPVSVVNPRASVLTWPNAIGPNDWSGWIQDRTLAIPSSADPRYSSVIETHDEGEAPNRNALLVASVGKGTYVYTSLTLFRQIAGGVPGSLRLLVNLVSAGHRGAVAPRVVR